MVSHFSEKKRKSLGRRLLIYIALFSTILTILMTIVQVYFDYKNGLERITYRIEQIELSFLDNLNNSVWLSDVNAVSIQLHGMMELQDMQYVEVKDDHDLFLHMGKKLSVNVIERQFELIHQLRNEIIPIGDLIVQFSLEGLYQRLWNKVVYIFVYQGIIIFLLSLFLYIIFYLSVGKHMLHIAEHFQSLGVGSKLKLNRKPHDQYEDELDILENSVNQMVAQVDTETKNNIEAQELLRLSEEKYRRYIDFSPEAVIIADKELVIMQVNKAAVEMMGYSEEELVGHSIREFWAEEEAERAEKENVEMQEKGYMKTIRKFRTKQNNEFFMLINAVEIVPGVNIGFGQDITEQIEMERQLKSLNENLQEQIQRELEKVHYQENIIQEQKRFVDMGQMINAVAHQWRQPLNNMHLIMQMVESIHEGDEYDFDVKDLFKQHEDLVHFMSKTIDDFRNFFAVQQKEKTNFKITRSVIDTVALTQARLAANNINLNLNCHCLGHEFDCNFVDSDDYCDKGNDLYYGYEGEFRQIIINIVNNAQDAIVENRTDLSQKDSIDITVRVSDNEFHIVIANTGSHIEDSVLPRIFDPYFTTKEEGKGTGIGLYMTKTIVKNELRGKIYARNSDDGVEFHLMIPRGSNEK